MKFMPNKGKIASEADILHLNRQVLHILMNLQTVFLLYQDSSRKVPARDLSIRSVMRYPCTNNLTYYPLQQDSYQLENQFNSCLKVLYSKG